MNHSVETPYDTIVYPPRSFEYTHPNRLATIAALYGMNPAPISECRVLDLGCGSGGNIMPMAYQFPGSTFVGIDLSGEAVATGTRSIDALGLKNISLHRRDILDVDDNFGRFDYIISHGVYSWVPPPVRDKILALMKRLLNPHGVGYVSFNAHPYSRMRDTVRDMMLFHTQHLTDPKEKISQSRAIMKFLSDATHSDSLHGKIMRAQLERIEGIADSLLFHDDLNPFAEAFLLHQVVAHAEKHRLKYLGDVDFARQDLAAYPEGVREVLATFPGDALLARDQYQDFIDGTGFRRSLLCHDDVVLTRMLASDFIRPFFLSAPFEAVFDRVQDSKENRKDDTSKSELSPTPDVLLAKTAYDVLTKAWPRALSFGELFDATLAAMAGGDPMDRSVAETHLAEAMSNAARHGQILFRAHRLDLTTDVSARPEISAVVRLQSQEGVIVTTMLHSLVVIEDRMVRAFLDKIDGTRTIDELQAEFTRLNAGIPDGATKPPDVEDILKKLAGAALLVR